MSGNGETPDKEREGIDSSKGGELSEILTVDTGVGDVLSGATGEREIEVVYPEGEEPDDVRVARILREISSDSGKGISYRDLTLEQQAELAKTANVGILETLFFQYRLGEIDLDKAFFIEVIKKNKNVNCKSLFEAIYSREEYKVEKDETTICLFSDEEFMKAFVSRYPNDDMTRFTGAFFSVLKGILGTKEENKYKPIIDLFIRKSPESREVVFENSIYLSDEQKRKLCEDEEYIMKFYLKEGEDIFSSKKLGGWAMNFQKPSKIDVMKHKIIILGREMKKRVFS
ncbi:MAG: hypothetical protein N4A38_02590 [Candidatus Gracilibacteria bacterium]|nr:hypothetical protein [Candidatus Gracilibacteria bacterium]